MTLDRYEMSGQAGKAPLFLVLIGLPVLALLAAAYAYLVVYIPLAGVISFLLMFGFVFGVGLTLSLVGSSGKCRSTGLMRLLGAAGGAIALYFAWVVFVHAVVNRHAKGDGVSLVQLLSSPGDLWSLICVINEHGWYSFKKLTPSGVVLWIFWAIEAVVVVGGASLIAPTGIENEMFCEGCNRWCTVDETRYVKIDAAMAQAPLADIDIPGLFRLESSEGKLFPSVRLEALKCPSCSVTRGLRCVRLTESVDEKGERSEKSETIPGVLLPPG